jgi:hypothetical protein
MVGEGILFAIIPIGLIVLAIASVGSRREPDPTGRRTQAIYALAVTFITLFTVVFSAFWIVSAAIKIPFDKPFPGGDSNCTSIGSGITCSSGMVSGSSGQGLSRPQGGAIAFTDVFPNRNEDVRALVLSLVIGLAALVVLVPHARRVQALAASPGFDSSPARPTYTAYLYTVCFVAVLTALAAGSAAAYGIFEVVAPGITGASRHGGLQNIVSSGVLTVVALALLRFHLNAARELGPTSGDVPGTV